MPFSGRWVTCGKVMTMDAVDIWRSAKLYIDQYGLLAEFRAGARAAECHSAGDEEGNQVWQAIYKAIDELRRVEMRDGEHTH
jgi:hypothetical protein